jgi:hypothetical protein
MRNFYYAADGNYISGANNDHGNLLSTAATRRMILLPRGLAVIISDYPWCGGRSGE